MKSDSIIKLGIFQKRLKKIGIDIEFGANWPWVYVTKIQGKSVTEKYLADWGFTIAFHNARGETNFTDTKEIFKLIRKYENR